MLGFYTPLIFLEGFCLYHAYKNNVEQRWYYLIIFLPVFGCLFYLYHHFYSRRGIENIGQTVKQVVNSNYRIEQLEKAHRFADNVTNKVNLADAYVSIGRYGDAINLYQECMSGFMADDPTLKMKILSAYFHDKAYDHVVALGKQLENEKTFRNAEERIAYSWSLHFVGKSNEAEAEFSAMNKTFTNYPHRLAYCKFLKGEGKNDLLQELITELTEEFEHMKGPERRLYRGIYSEVREMSRK
jgi:hypothetical protein